MGRFNWIWRTLRTLSVVMCGVWLPSTASSFGFPGTAWGMHDRSASMGLCIVRTHVSAAGVAAVSLDITAYDASTQFLFAGGSTWFMYVNSFDGSLALTTGALSTCLGVGTDDITNLIQIGANNGETIVGETRWDFLSPYLIPW